MAMPDDDPPAGVPEWVVTYGDMMSLLLTFFIMLVSMSEMKDDTGKMRAMMDSMMKTFGLHDGLSGIPGSSTQQTSINTNRSSQGTSGEGGTKKGGPKSKKGNAGEHLTVERINHGTEVTLGGPTAFPHFQADLTDEMKQNLDTLADILRDKPNRIIVRGHCSSEPLPPDSKFRDAVDLSFARARQTSQYLADRGIRREYMVVSAVGDAEPRIITRVPELHRLNDRVDVFVIDAYITPPASDNRN
ncbi:MAG: OmpA family protein [Planctomycetota bacterium]|nr:OmpA family protein [Planctomycetota bacterium]MDA1211087.1 OmpA family protein [Planctomycetota bacterium]